MRTLGVVTGGRADFGIYRPLLQAILADPSLRLHLYVTGMHLSPEFGCTVRDIEAEGFPIGDRVEMLLASDSPEGIAKAIGLGTLGFAQAFGRTLPDVLVLLGDRFEMLAAASAALPFNLPVAHIHGGEVTEGAIDECIRHTLTKLSHLHFASTEGHAHRIRQLGEEASRVHTCGALSLDNLKDLTLLDRETLERRFGLDLSEAPLLVTFHPVTREWTQMPRQVEELLAALDASGLPLLFTLPNADTQGRLLISRFRTFCEGRPRTWMVDNLGSQAYFSLMRLASAMVGNSSSGLLEAPSFGLPVVNVGTRQQGRTRGSNVLDTGTNRQGILAAIARATAPAFRASLQNTPNPYQPVGRAAEVIVQVLRDTPLDGLCFKPFVDLGQEGLP